MTHISVIIPTRNRCAILGRSLPRLFDQTLPAHMYEIIVVDDGSQDDTRAMIAAMAFPDLICFGHETSRGPAAARNTALRQAKGHLLVFVDDDAFVPRDFLEAHRARHEQTPHAIVTGPIIEVTDIPAPVASFRSSWRGRHGSPLPSGNASVAKASVLDAGGFDEDFTEYGWEDPELYIRLRRLGMRRVYEPSAPIFHYKTRETRADFAARLRAEDMRGRMGALFYAKHRDSSVANWTKQRLLFQALEIWLDKSLNLHARAERVLAGKGTPTSALMRWLLINHVEISSGRKAWRALGSTRRVALARGEKLDIPLRMLTEKMP